MTTLWGMMENVLRAIITDRGSKTETQWDIMFVSDKGRVVRIKDFKRQVVLLLLTLLAALIIILCCLILLIGEKTTVDRLKSSLARSQETITELVDENDALVARLVALQKAKEKISGTAKTTIPGIDSASTSASVGQENKLKDGNDQTENNGAIVAVDNLSVAMIAGTDQIKINFAISKIDEQRQYVSGRVFVVLKSQNDEGLRQVIPPVSLINGAPTRINAGQFFSIARYKPVIMTTRTDYKPDDFQKATVLIFTPEGEPIFKKTFTITVRMVAAAPESEAEETSEQQASPESPNNFSTLQPETFRTPAAAASNNNEPTTTNTQAASTTQDEAPGDTTDNQDQPPVTASTTPEPSTPEASMTQQP